MQNLSDQVDQTWSPYYYVLIGFRYGYADNLPNFTDDADITSYNYEGCGIDISWAVDDQRQPVNLDHIDFVRVYTGLNQKCPQPEWWGETSTEIIGAEDLHLEASLEATGMDGLQFTVYGLQEKATVSTNRPTAYDLRGVRRQESGVSRPEILIKNGKKFFLK